MRITIVICRTTDGHPGMAEEENALASLCAAQAGLDVLIAPDLYHLPERSDLWDTLRSIPAPPVIASGRHPRPIAALLRKHGVAFRGDPLDLSALDSTQARFDALLAALGDVSCACEPGEVSEIAPVLAKRWYPVVDRNRCTSCGHCLQFCIFDVYTADGQGGVSVTNPENCKTGCPACSRICPQSAIMFPCYDKDPAIAGAPGLFVDSSVDSRRALYARTKRLCPVCGRVPTPDVPAAADPTQPTCSQCGLPMPSANRVPDEIDRLIDDLENLTRKNPR